MSDPFCNFYVGQRVTLISNDAPGSPVYYAGIRIDRPKSGVVYTVRDIYFDVGEMRVGIRLVEVVNPPAPWADGYMENGWWHGHFRPVTDISELEKLLNRKFSPLDTFKSLEPV